MTQRRNERGPRVERGPRRFSRLLVALRRRLLSRRLGLTSIEIIPIQNRVEAKEVRALRLPPPERTNAEHDDVPVPDLRVHDLRTTRQRLTTSERPRQQHVVRVLRERHDDTWTRGRIGTTAETTAASATTTASATRSTGKLAKAR